MDEVVADLDNGLGRGFIPRPVVGSEICALNVGDRACCGRLILCTFGVVVVGRKCGFSDGGDVTRG